MKRFPTSLFFLYWFSAVLSAGESYRIETISFPDDMPPEVGAVEFASDGELYVALRRGDIMVAKPTSAPDAFEWRRFANGFHNPCGIHIISPGHIIISQMAELTEVIDQNGDGIADEYRALSTDFGLSGNYHETMDICPDGKDGYYLAPGTASHNGPTFQTPRGQYSKAGRLGRNYSSVQWRGWVLHWSPEKGITPVSSGYRMHNGIERAPDGSIWCGDNQGDWRSSSPVYHVTPDSFSGHPSSLIWDPRFATIPNPLNLPRVLLDDLWNKPAFRLPRDFMNSCAEPVFDTTEGAFGPFTSQLFIPDQSGNRIVRCMPEMVDGAHQGAATPFIDGNGLERGNNRLAFSPDGSSLYVGQTGRGWGKLSEGLQRITYTGELPTDVQNCTLTDTGFEVAFTKDLKDLQFLEIERFRYRYSYTYGGDEEEKQTLTPQRAEIAEENPNRLQIALNASDLLPNYCYRIIIKSRAVDESAYSGTLVYTLNRLRRPASPHQVTITPSGDSRFRIEIDDELFTEYHLKGFSNPILYPIANASGQAMTRDWPIRTDGRSGEQHDHPHHKSLFIGHESVNEIDFWHEGANDGSIKHARTIETRSGEDRALLRTFNLWESPEGEIVCSDTRELQFGVANGIRYIDLELSLHASHGEVRFGEKKDGLIGLRTHPDLRLKPAPAKGVAEVFGQAQNAKGTEGEAIWGEKANWVHYWGQIDGRDAGIAILAHPDNPRSPTWWHAREYGLVSANPFGPTKNSGDGALTLQPGETLTLRYRFLFHDRSAEAASVSDQYEQFASAPLYPRTLTEPIPQSTEDSVPVVPENVIPRGSVISAASRSIKGETADTPKVATHGLLEGKPVFQDREYVFTKIPEHLRGGDHVLTFNDDKKTGANYEVTISEPGMLLLLVDTRVEKEVEWLKSGLSKLKFERTEDTIQTNMDFVYQVYLAEVDPGTYQLGSQTGGSFYSIAAVNRD
tara:strand:+ start:6940 stop:9825 length:2886 start_codon:yes stop_codon:yes gene_type:complete